MTLDIAEIYKMGNGAPPNGETLKSRMSVVTDLAKKLDPGQVLELVRFHNGLMERDSVFFKSFVDAFKSKDNTFVAADNDNEIRLLSAATLHAGMTATKKDGLQAEICLAIGCSASSLSEGEPLIAALQKQARSEQSKLAKARRLRPSKAARVRALPDFSSAVNTLKAQQDPGAVATQVSALVEKLTNGMTLTVQSANAVIQSLNATLNAQSEELDALWWLLGERTSSGKSFSELEAELLVIEAARDLGQVNRIAPPASSAQALLSRCLELGKTTKDELTLSALVTAQDESEAPQWLNDFDAKRFRGVCPCLIALSSGTELRDTSGWEKKLHDKFCVKTDLALPSEEIARQLMEEVVLANACEGLKVDQEDE